MQISTLANQRICESAINQLNTKTMKKTAITLSIIILSLLSCRTIKDSSTVANSVQQQSGHSSIVDWMYAASTGRYWHYRTDSLLFYHPDVGVYGVGGWLNVSESQVSQGEVMIKQDSFDFQRLEATAERAVATGKRRSWWGWGVVAASIGLVCCINVIRRFS